MKHANLKQQKISLTDKEYVSLCDEAKRLGMSFSTYARFLLINREVPSETPIRKALSTT